MAGSIGSVSSTEKRDRTSELDTPAQPQKAQDPSAVRLATVRHADARLAELAGSAKPMDVFSQTPATKPTVATFNATSSEVSTAALVLATAKTPEARGAAATRLHEVQGKWVAQAKSLGYAEPRGFRLTQSTDADLLK